MRDTFTKGFLTEDGRISQITSAEAMHYLHDSGAYEEIDLNIKATPTGWEVNENLFVTSFGAEVARGQPRRDTKRIHEALSFLQ